MKKSLNRGHPERRLNFKIGDVLSNKTNGATFQVVGWVPCFFKDPPYDARERRRQSKARGIDDGDCDQCPNGLTLMKIKSVDSKLLTPGYMHTECWCLGGGKEPSWEKEEEKNEKNSQ